MLAVLETARKLGELGRAPGKPGEGEDLPRALKKRPAAPEIAPRASIRVQQGRPALSVFRGQHEVARSFSSSPIEL